MFKEEMHEWACVVAFKGSLMLLRGKHCTDNYHSVTKWHSCYVFYEHYYTMVAALFASQPRSLQYTYTVESPTFLQIF